MVICLLKKMKIKINSWYIIRYIKIHINMNPLLSVSKFTKIKSGRLLSTSYMNNYNMQDLVNKSMNAAKDGANELKKEALVSALDNAVFVLKESEKKMLDHKLNNITCEISINVGPIGISISKNIIAEKE